VEARRLHLEQGCSSMFDYCVRVLRFSEGVAYKRIGVARVVRRFPDVGLAISRGELHLSAASLIAPHLSAETVSEWLRASRDKTTREIKQLVADRFPREGFQSSVRRVSSHSKHAERVLREKSGPGQSNLKRAVSTPSHPPRHATTDIQQAALSTAPMEECRRGKTEALGAEKYSVRFTADEKVHAQLQELRSLLRHSVPDGDVGKIVARAIGALLEQARKKKIGACDSARSVGESESRKSEAKATSSHAKTPVKRNIPVAIRRAVWSRDAGRCAYQSKNGRRCGSSEAVEFHHQIPWARCRAHTVDNIALRCRAHNQYEAELDFGAEHMAQFRRKAIDLEEIPR